MLISFLFVVFYTNVFIIIKDSKFVLAILQHVHSFILHIFLFGVSENGWMASLSLVSRAAAILSQWQSLEQSLSETAVLLCV